MEQEIQREFLKETIDNLEDLQNEMQKQLAEIISTEFLRQIFRQVHTIKGTAQTFGFENLSRFSHIFENLLQAINVNSVQQNRETKFLIEESVSHLLKLCQKADLRQTELIERISRLIPTKEENSAPNILDEKIPKSLLKKLSAAETVNLKSAIERGESFYLIEVFFDFADFNERFISFRQILEKTGAVIAVSPAAKINSAKEIGFQIFYTVNSDSVAVAEMIKAYEAAIDFSTDSSNEKYSADLAGVLANLVADGERKVRILDKRVSFEVSNKLSEISRADLVLVKNSLLHLLRNAIDHAIESPENRIANGKSPTGKIKISIFKNNDDLILRVEDDGSGIDAEKIFARAKERGLINDNQNLTKTEIINLIFAHGFSTSEVVSDISGRGVGLDVVKDLIEKAGGAISVETEVNRGTIFKISLPF